MKRFAAMLAVSVLMVLFTTLLVKVLKIITMMSSEQEMVKLVYSTV